MKEAWRREKSKRQSVKTSKRSVLWPPDPLFSGSRPLAVCRGSGFWLLVFGFSCGSVAWAQDASPAPSRSFLEIIREGAEWPGLIIAAMSLTALTIVIEHFWTI